MSPSIVATVHGCAPSLLPPLNPRPSRLRLPDVDTAIACREEQCRYATLRSTRLRLTQRCMLSGLDLASQTKESAALDTVPNASAAKDSAS